MLEKLKAPSEDNKTTWRAVGSSSHPRARETESSQSPDAPSKWDQKGTLLADNWNRGGDAAAARDARSRDMKEKDTDTSSSHLLTECLPLTLDKPSPLGKRVWEEESAAANLKDKPGQ